MELFNWIHHVYLVLFIFGNPTFQTFHNSPWSRVDLSSLESTRESTRPTEKCSNVGFPKMYNIGQWWRSGTRCGCKTDWLWVRSPLEEMKYLLKFKYIFPFPRSGVEDKRGVEFCHLTRNASRIWQKVGNGVS